MILLESGRFARLLLGWFSGFQRHRRAHRDALNIAVANRNLAGVLLVRCRCE